MNSDILQAAVNLFPETLRYVSDAVYHSVKTQDSYFRQLWKNVLSLYRGEQSASDFAGQLADIIQQQITRAYRAALSDEGLDPELVNTDYKDNVEAVILSEYDFVDGFAADIRKAAKDEAGYEQFRVRSEMWANRYPDAYNKAKLEIALEMGDKLIWKLGETEQHCETCARLNGTIATAKEWEQSGLRPQNPPNDYLSCGGWQCDCKLEITKEKLSRNRKQKLGI